MDVRELSCFLGFGGLKSWPPASVWWSPEAAAFRVRGWVAAQPGGVYARRPLIGYLSRISATQPDEIRPSRDIIWD